MQETKLFFRSKEEPDNILDEQAHQRQKEKERRTLANFRIELTFGSNRSVTKPCSCLVRVWKISKDLTGHGDSTLMFCGGKTCFTPFNPMLMEDDYVVCPACLTKYDQDECTATLEIPSITMQELALFCSRLFLTLKGDCDVVAQWHKASAKKADTRHIDGLRTHHQTKERVVYPYWRIVDDTKHGQSLVERFLAFFG